MGSWNAEEVVAFDPAEPPVVREHADGDHLCLAEGFKDAQLTAGLQRPPPGLLLFSSHVNLWFRTLMLVGFKDRCMYTRKVSMYAMLFSHIITSELANHKHICKE